MYLQRISRIKFRKNGTESKQPEIRYLFRCDKCEQEYEKKPCNVNVSKSGLHFCSNKCKFASFKRGGVLKSIAEATSMKNYGTTSPMSSEIVKEKMRKGFQHKYGSDVTSPLHVPGAKEKRKQTHLERYGFSETFQIEEFKIKRQKTWLKHFGVPYRPFSEEDLIKSQLSMMKYPQKWSSKIEEDMCNMLTIKFGNIVRQKRVYKWAIDAYVPIIDTYVQLDGVYWHGLNRPINTIKESTGPRDQAIYQKWLNDIEQNKWFNEKGLKLIRITDFQFKIDGIDSINR